MDGKERSEEVGLVQGENLPVLKKTVTQAMINRWAEISGDFNPLHIDPEFGKRSFFGSNIAHGPLILTFVIEMLTRTLGKAWISNGRLESIKIVSPVVPGTNLVVGGKVTSALREESQTLLQCEIFVKRDDEKLVVTGNAVCRV